MTAVAVWFITMRSVKFQPRPLTFYDIDLPTRNAWRGERRKCGGGGFIGGFSALLIQPKFPCYEDLQDESIHVRAGACVLNSERGRTRTPLNAATDKCVSSAVVRLLNFR